jgi:hypothetical protein
MRFMACFALLAVIAYHYALTPTPALAAGARPRSR